MRGIAVVIALGIGLSSCKDRNSSAVNEENGGSGTSTASVMSQIYAAHAEVSTMPVLRVSEVWQKVVAAGGYADGAKLLGGVLGRILVGQNRGLVTQILSAGLGSAVPTSLLFPVGEGVLTAQEVSLLATRLVPFIAINPKLLDTLVTLDMKILPTLQMQQLQSGTGPGTNGPVIKAFIPALPEDLKLDVSPGNCVIPEDPFQPLQQVAAGTLVMGKQLIRDNVDPCFFDRSAAFATVLNALANNETDGDGEGLLPVQFAAEGAPARSVTRVSDLVEALGASGFTIELFTTRMFVEFRPLAWQDTSGKRSSIQLNTWILGKAGEKYVRVSAEHAELGMTIHKDGKRFAQVRWYAGLPDAARPDQLAFWRPFTELGTPWGAPAFEFITVFPPGDQGAAEGVRKWLNSAAEVMVAYQAVEEAYKPPYIAYGLMVCSDSLAIAMDKIMEPRTEAFPLVRAQARFRPNSMTLEEHIEKYAHIPPGELSRRYPSDTVVALDPVAWRARLGRAFPDPDSPRLKYFPETRAMLKATVHN